MGGHGFRSALVVSFRYVRARSVETATEFLTDLVRPQVRIDGAAAALCRRGVQSAPKRLPRTNACPTRSARVVEREQPRRQARMPRSLSRDPTRVFGDASKERFHWCLVVRRPKTDPPCKGLENHRSDKTPVELFRVLCTEMRMSNRILPSRLPDPTRWRKKRSVLNTYCPQR